MVAISLSQGAFTWPVKAHGVDYSVLVDPVIYGVLVSPGVAPPNPVVAVVAPKSIDIGSPKG